MTKLITTKQLNDIIKAHAAGDYAAHKYLLNTQPLPELTEDQALALAGITQVSKLVFEDVHANPFDRDTMLSTTGEENHPFVDVSMSVIQFIRLSSYSMETNTEYLEEAINKVEATLPDLKRILKLVEEFNAIPSFYDENCAKVSKVCLQVEARLTAYREMTDIELLRLEMTMPNGRDKDEVSGVLQARIEAQRIARSQAMEVYSPLNTTHSGDNHNRQGLDNMAVGHTIHAGDAMPQSVSGFNNRALDKWYKM